MRGILREVNDELDYLYRRVEELEGDFDNMEVERDDLIIELDVLRADLKNPKYLLNLLAELKEGD